VAGGFGLAARSACHILTFSLLFYLLLFAFAWFLHLLFFFCSLVSYRELEMVQGFRLLKKNMAIHGVEEGVTNYGYGTADVRIFAGRLFSCIIFFS
jgi:hypothetical protein